MGNNDILMLYIHNEGKPVIAERFLKILKSKIYKKMTANDRKTYLNYLIKLVDQQYNTYHHSIKKNSSNTDYSASTENIESNPIIIKFNVNDRVRITKYKIIFSKGYKITDL